MKKNQPKSVNKNVIIICFALLVLSSILMVIYAIQISNKHPKPTADIPSNQNSALIIGNYVVYIDPDNKVTDINTFTRETQTWGKQYAGWDLSAIKEKIDNGEDLQQTAEEE